MAYKHFQGSVIKTNTSDGIAASILSSYQTEGDRVKGQSPLSEENIEAGAEAVVTHFEGEEVPEDEILGPEAYVDADGNEQPISGDVEAAELPYNSKLLNHTYQQALSLKATDFRFYKHGAHKYVKKIVNVGTKWLPWLVVRWEDWQWMPLGFYQDFKRSPSQGKLSSNMYPVYSWRYEGLLSKIPGE